MSKCNGHNGISDDPNSRCKILSKHSIGIYNTYVLHTAFNNNSETLAAALSNNTIKVFQGFDLKSSVDLKGHESQITGLKFSQEEPNILISSSLDSTIRIWDTRIKGSCVQTFSDTSDDIVKPLLSFDYNADERIICTGTELIREDAFLIFWDRRTCANLGGYWESHTDDVTQVCFHPSETSQLASGSVDGLINIFDLNAGREDDAILHTLNTGSSVSKLTWKADSSKSTPDQLSCITHIEEYQLWTVTEDISLQAKPQLAFDRFSKKLKFEIDYFIDSFTLNGYVCIAGGTKSGNVSLSLARKKPVLLSTLNNEHKDMVRSVTWSEQHNVLATGGEDGLVCLWSCSLT